MAQVWKRAAAKRDLVHHYVYLAENAGQETADRFLLQSSASFAELASHSEMGATLTVGRPELAGLRKWPVRGFERFLIFYLPHTECVPNPSVWAGVLYSTTVLLLEVTVSLG